MVARIELEIECPVPLRGGGYSKLIYLGDAPYSVGKTHNRRRVRVRCGCGVEFTTLLTHVRSGASSACVQCGFQKTGEASRKDLSGCSVGHWEVLYVSSPGTKSRPMTYMCRCCCGVEKQVSASSLLAEESKSCGCKTVEMIKEATREKVFPGTRYGIYEVIRRREDGKVEALNTKTGAPVCMNLGSLKAFAHPEKARIKNLISTMLRRGAVGRRGEAMELLGDTVENVRSYLGNCPDGYTIDHICPVSQATTLEEYKKLQHYTNLQWMTLSDNIRKGGSKTPEGCRLCLELLGRDWID